MMKVRFAEIPAEGLALEIHDQAWFPDQDITRSGPVRARVHLLQKGEDRVLLSGEMAIPLALDCDRCLREFTKTITHSFRLDLELADSDTMEPVEHGCSVAEMDMLYLQKPEIDLFLILAQQVFLLMPTKKICSEECKGLCPQCGTNRNEKTCRCQAELKSSPFGVLAGLKR
jgi:uncharacterized protein